MSTTLSYLNCRFVASSDVDQSVGFKNVVDFVSGVFVQSAHGNCYYASTSTKE